jgi:hypothetical protein
MSKKIKFKVSDKLVKQRDGAGYSLSNYTEGVDYVMRGCFKGQKAVFREDILGVSVVDPNVVEHKQEPAVIAELTQPQPESGPESTEPSTEKWRPATPVSTEPEIQVNNFDGLLPSYCPVQECKIKKIYANFKWVETDKGRVWVGLKGSTMRVNQVIRVLNGELFLGKTVAGPSLVRI